MKLLAETKRPGPEPPPARPLRVLLVTQSSGGGAGRHFLDLAQELDSMGVEVQGIFAPRTLDVSFRQRLASGTLPPMYELPMRRAIHPLDAADLWQMIRLIKSIGPFDIIHGHSSKGGALARFAALRLGVASVYTPHAFVTLDPHLPAWKRKFYGGIERWLARSTSAIIAVSGDEAEHAKSLRIGAERMHVVPNGIERPPFSERHSVRRELGIGDSEVVFGFVGRFSRQKAPDVMLEAFDQVAAQQPHARLLMIGNGPLDEDVHRRAKKSPFANRITLLGDVVAVEYMSAFDVFCLSSRYEGMPYVYLEALAAGLPIVSTNVGGVSMCVEPGANGSIVPCEEPGLLAVEMLRLLDPALRQSFGRASLRMAETYTVRDMTERTLDIYTQVLASRAATGIV